MRLVFALVVLIAFVTPQGSQPIRVTGSGFDGAIIRGIDRRPSDGRNSKSCCDWTPTEDQVRQAEALLPAYLWSAEAARVLHNTRIRSHLQGYKRQYWGQTRGKLRQIQIHFYHQNSNVVTTGTWLKTAVAVNGGGDHYFQVTYDVDNRRFVNLWVNAPE